MKIKVHKNTLADNVFEKLKSQGFSSRENENLVLGKEYLVHGIVFWDSIPFYYIYENEKDDYPVPYCFDFFEVVDPTPSKYWELSVDISHTGNVQSFLVFKEWADDVSLYERLLEDDISATKIFSRYRALLQQEKAHVD